MSALLAAAAAAVATAAAAATMLVFHGGRLFAGVPTNHLDCDRTARHGGRLAATLDDHRGPDVHLRPVSLDYRKQGRRADCPSPPMVFKRP